MARTAGQLSLAFGTWLQIPALPFASCIISIKFYLTSLSFRVFKNQ